LPIALASGQNQTDKKALAEVIKIKIPVASAKFVLKQKG
jgi:hypothetical protein